MKRIITFCGLALISMISAARPVHAFCAGALIKEIQNIAQHTEIVEAVKQANARKPSQENILELDKRWIERMGKIPEAQEILANRTSALLITEMNKRSYFREAILTGKLGETIAMNLVTSDYWQGDEEKFTEIFDANVPSRKPDSHVSRARWDESTSAMISQVSVPVYEAGLMIGTLTVGVDLKRVPPQNH